MGRYSYARSGALPGTELRRTACAGIAAAQSEHGDCYLLRPAVHLVDGRQADVHAIDCAGTRRFHTRRDATLCTGTCLVRTATRGGEQQLNRARSIWPLRMLR